MHKINDVIVQDGKVVLSHLPFHDGQHVQIVVTEVESASPKLSIAEVRKALQGKVERFVDPTDPMIPDDSWEMQQ
jgi:hypothetical protein